MPDLAVVPSDVQPPEGYIVSPHNLNMRHEPGYVDHVLEVLVCVCVRRGRGGEGSEGSEWEGKGGGEEG